MKLADFALVDSDAERDDLLARLARFNDTARPYDRDRTLHELFEAVAAAHPHRPAMLSDGRPWTYGELSRRSDQMARLVARHLPDPAAARVVAIMLDNSFDLLAALLGTWKAGAVYLPLNPVLPLERIRHMLVDAGAGFLVCERRTIREANRLQWECPALATLLCVDSHDTDLEPEAPNELMSRELWDYVGAEATDDISGGGWVSSFTGEPLSREVMDDYAGNVFAKLAPLLTPFTRVLEIGCASGITLFRLAPYAGFYYGIDLSAEILAKTESERERRGLAHVHLRCLPAHEIDLLEEGDFDLIMVNSVVQSFHGHNYLRGVLRKAVGLLRDHGRIFVGDVMDQDRKEELVASLEAFKRDHPGLPTKTDWENELFLSRRFWDDLRFDLPAVVRADASEKRQGVDSELSRFRYDVLLTVDKAAAAPPPGEPWRRRLDARHLDGPDREPAAPAPVGHAEDPAYIMYTSGTTGRPKGVVVTHRSLHNYAQWACRTYFADGADGGDMPLFTSPAFDLTLTSIVCPLLAGRTIHARRADDPDRLLADLFGPGSPVDAVKLTPAHVTILGGLGGLGLPEAGTPVRTAIVGGEDLTPEQVAILRRLRPDMRIWNEYGPTEATIGCTVALIGAPPITIGRPIDNTEVWVLDAAGEVRPVGMVGELCVAGDGLALGYWHDPELTAAKFVRHPIHRPQTGRRLYRTGDRAKWLPDGDLLLLGRVDRQVKIRGNRIELGEVEERLRALPAVAEAVVVDRRVGVGGAGGAGETCLCAYVVARGPVDVTHLREELARSLPDFMVPTYFVPLPELPLSANGKVDRRALPEPDDLARAAGQGGAAYEPPRTELERTLAAIWREVLGVERVGLSDGFFDLGGHSLKATQLVSRIHRAVGVRLPLRDVFKSPTLRGVSEAVARARRGTWSAVERLPEAPWYDISHAQRRLWVLQQLEEAPQAYNVLEALRLRGALDEEVLTRAFRALVARHESLRTTLIQVDGEPKQRVGSEPCFELERLDLSGEDDPAAAALAHLERLAARPFDLAAGPLVRLALLRLAPDEWALGLSLHHVISDGWSSAVLVRDFTALYGAFAAGREPDLPPLRVHYRDYSAWQNRLIAETEAEAREHRGYWHARLAPELPLLDLPTDAPRPPVKGFAGDVHVLRLPVATLAGLHELGRARNASLFMVLLAAVKALLHRWTGQEDILVGSPIAGRVHTDLEDQIGFYVNTLALRDRVQGSAPFAGLLAAVRQTTLEAYEHQIYPFDRLVEELPLPRDTSRSPLFDVLVVLQNTRPARLDLPGVEIEPLEIPSRTSKFDLSLQFAESAEEGLLVGLEYSTGLFTRDRVRRLGAQLETLLESVLRDPGRPVAELALLPASELHQVLFGFNATGTAAPPPDLLQAFGARVEAAPDRIVVVCGERALSYAELDRRSSALAGRLHARGARAGDRVAVLLDRSEAGLLALLAILKTGGAYVPLDPAYPEERLAVMLADSGARAVLAAPGRLPLLQRIGGPDLPCIDPEGGGASLPGRGAAGSGGGQEGGSSLLAYIVFTSGSTGRPKGVAGTRLCLSNLMAWQRAAVGEGLRSAQYAALSFDVSVQEMLFAATSGGTLCVVDDATRLEPRRLLAWLREREVEMLTLPFSALGLLFADAATLPELPALRHLATSGEQLVLSTPLRRLLALRPALRLHNQYGPSETHVVTSHTLAGGGETLPELPPIGRPIDGCRTHVLAALEPVPIGVNGELCLGGVQLAAGYLGDPALTAARFVPDPWGDPREGGGRLYRTGDLCRWRPDGTIDFLGRVDGQVKIRGHRVELGEVEHALLDHPAVEAACVVASASSTGATGSSRELVAYLVSGDPPAASELRAHMARTLPEPMLPARFVAVPRLPRTPSGKVDRRAVVAAAGLEARDLREGASCYAPPVTEVQRELAAIWEEILGGGPVGLDDGFFERGGHSLKAVQAAAEIRRRLGAEVPLLQIFRTPRLRDLADWVEEVRTYEDRHAGDAAVLLDDRERESPSTVFALPPILGYGVAFHGLARVLPGHAVYGLDFLEGEDRLERYARLLERIQPAGPFVLFGYSAGGNLAFELARELEARGRRVSDVVMLDTYRLIPQEAAPLEEIEDEIRANLEYFGAHIEADPYFAMYVTNPRIRELLEGKMAAYIRYYRRLVNSGTVAADLHLVFSANPEEETDRRRSAWADATTGAFKTYQGTGRHTDMLLGENLEPNARLLRSIFDEAVSM